MALLSIHSRIVLVFRDETHNQMPLLIAAALYDRSAGERWACQERGKQIELLFQHRPAGRGAQRHADCVFGGATDIERIACDDGQAGASGNFGKR